MPSDKTLKCRDCGEQFVFTAGEQEFYAQKGFENEPTRCASCRRAKKARMESGGGQLREPQPFGSRSPGGAPFRSSYDSKRYY
jgi:hypothetical protein